MTAAGWVEIAVFLAVLTAITPLLGAYLARVFEGDAMFLAFIERPVYRLLGVHPERGQDWKAYARSVLVFSALSVLVLYGILRTQGLHPFNPQDLASPTWDVSFNTAASFVTNTNWQYYAGETTLSYFSQMAGVAVQNFASAGVGIAVLAALIRGIAARSGTSLGNFYADLARIVLYVLVPMSAGVGLVLASQGVLQTLGGSLDVPTLTGGSQTLARGPVASQEAIKVLGTNGGGFFNVNSAMPFENPTWLSNFIEMLAILAIPAGLTAAYGRMVGNRRQGWALFGAMMLLFAIAVAVVYVAESKPRRRWRPPGSPGRTWRARSSASVSARARCSSPSPPRPRAVRSTRPWSR